MIKPKVTTDVGDGQIGVSPGIPVTATVTSGRLTNVVLTDVANNSPVAGALAADGLTWQNTDPLGYNHRYVLHADAVGLGGAMSTNAAFTTSSPANLTMPYVTPDPDEVVGIGQPVSVRFDENIPDRLAAQQAIKITTDPPVDGAFYWLNSREVRWRPKDFWVPGTKVKLDVNTYGANLGGGLYGQAAVHQNFVIGDAVVFAADDNTEHVVVTRNGQVIKDMPTSMGKASTPTDNGVYIVGGRFKQIIMDSSTFGIPVNSPGGYRVPVDWATQIAYNGVFMHSAPWSVWAQGSSDTSHGCLNLSPADAEWTYDNTKRGDVVIVKNTKSGILSGTDGLGDWNVPWDVWKAGNAAEQH